MLLGNYFNENRRPIGDCTVLVFPRMGKQNLSNKDRKNQFFFSVQVESPIISPLLQKLDEDGLFPEGEL